MYAYSGNCQVKAEPKRPKLKTMNSNKGNFSLSGVMKWFGSRPIKDGKKELLFSELLSLLSSGLDFSRSFKLLISGEDDDAM